MKVGDRVRIRGGAITGPQRVGDIGTVVENDGENIYPYMVDVGGYRYPYDSEELELVARVNVLPTPPAGMSPDDLSGYVDSFVKAAVARVRGEGARQYASPDGQRFERMTPREVIEWAREEARDLAVYAAMTDILLARVSDALDAKGVADVR